MPVLKVKKAGSQHAILLSKEPMTQLGVKEGDHLYLSVTPNGELRVARVDPQTAAHLKSAHKIMDEDRDELQAMANGK